MSCDVAKTQHIAKNHEELAANEGAVNSASSNATAQLLAEPKLIGWALSWIEPASLIGAIDSCTHFLMDNAYETWNLWRDSRVRSNNYYGAFTPEL